MLPGGLVVRIRCSVKVQPLDQQHHTIWWLREMQILGWYHTPTEAGTPEPGGGAICVLTSTQGEPEKPA